MEGTHKCHNGLAPCMAIVKEQIIQLWSGDTYLTRNCDPQWERGCRNKSEALALKGGAIVGILVTGILGVAIPLLGKRVSFLRSDRSFFFVAKAFAAGVVLATAFVHILPDAMSTLENGCLPASPWKKFPFSGFLAMVASLATMVVDLVSTGYFERKQQHQKDPEKQQQGVTDTDVEAATAPLAASEQRKPVQVRLHIVGMHAHAAAHGHKHPGGQHGKHDQDSHDHGHGHGHGHSHLAPTLSNMEADDELARVRHVVVSQVLELGIITHSIVIGFSLGVSQSPCTIRPLLGALAVHQFFEGFALGGCISQAGFRLSSMIIMAICFAITTPLGIGIGTGVSEVYNPHSPKALIVEGIFYSLSAGILVYMALVNLIAADFLSKRMRCNQRLQVLSFIALLLGAVLMSLLALWA